MYRRNGIIDIILDWAIDWLFYWGKKIFKRKAKTEEFVAIKKIPTNPDPDRFFRGWAMGERMMINALPEIQLTIKQASKSVDEIVRIICGDDLLVIHTGHEDDECPGKSFTEGLREILSGKPSTWQIRECVYRHAQYAQPCLGTLELFLAQEFEGNMPGKPNRDICTVYLDRYLGPMELELRIPHYGVRDKYLKVIYLRVDLVVDPERGIIVTGHEDNMDPRPQ